MTLPKIKFMGENTREARSNEVLKQREGFQYRELNFTTDLGASNGS